MLITLILLILLIMLLIVLLIMLIMSSMSGLSGSSQFGQCPNQDFGRSSSQYTCSQASIGFHPTSLYSASPGVEAFLSMNNGLFAQTIDAIMARPSRNRGLLPCTRDMVRLLILLWTRQSMGADAVHSYAETVKSMQYVGERPPHEQPPVLKAIPLSTPSAVLFKLLDLVTQLRCVSHRCFHFMIDKCLKLPVEHLPPRDPRANGKGMLVGKYRTEGLLTDPSQRPQGIPYVPVDIGPMTRLKEQRLLGSLLHVVFFLRYTHGLRKVFDHSRNIATCRRPPSGNVAGFWERFESGHTSLPEQLRTVLWLDEQAGGRGNVLSWLRSDACFEESRCCQQYTLVAGDQEQWDGTKYSTMYGKSRKVSGHSPIRHTDLSTFRPYGLVFWETSRLEALGYPTEGNLMPLWFALSSIFSEKDWEETIQRQQARY
ncbi:hypothetical protein BDW66DRAFT_168305 [Aspergillus desertorum]